MHCYKELNEAGQASDSLFAKGYKYIGIVRDTDVDGFSQYVLVFKPEHVHARPLVCERYAEGWEGKAIPDGYGAYPESYPDFITRHDEPTHLDLYGWAEDHDYFGQFEE